MIKSSFFYIFFLLCFLCTPLLAQIPSTEISVDAGIDHHYLSINYMGGGAAFFDLDNDGDDDIWVVGGLNQDVLYENDGAGNFTEIGTQAGLEITTNRVTTGVVTADLDNDGFRDVLVLPHIGFYPLLFKNNGDATFTEMSFEAGLGDYIGQAHAASFADVNLDGYLDIYVATYIDNINNVYNNNGAVVGFDHTCLNNFLFLNNGNMTFTEASSALNVKDGGCALATTFTDVDGDSDSDLMIANDFGEWVVPNALYENNFPSIQFNDIGESSGADVPLYGMGIAIGDYDRDEDLDYYITNLGKNSLLQNQGNTQFIDNATFAKVEDTYMDSLLAIGWGTAFMDVDNDTDLDLFVCNGYIPAADFIANSIENKNRLFINNANEEEDNYTFTEVAYDSDLDDIGRGRGFAYSDIDNDGDLDFLVININRQATSLPIQNIRLFRNDSNSDNHWLKVNLEGVTNNKDGFGATIRIVISDFSWVHDYNGGGGSHNSQHSSTAHFGLGTHQVVDSLVVTWPGGEQQILTNIPADQTINIVEGAVINNTFLAANNAQLKAFPNPFESQILFQIELKNPTDISLVVFDPLGRKVTTIYNDWINAGEHIFNWIPTHQSKGWYTLQLKTNTQTISRKVFYK